MSASRTNWAGNLVFAAERLAEPGSIEELQELVASSSRVKAVGSGHSFTSVADTTGVQVSLHNLERRIEVDAEDRTATVPAWATYAEIADAIHDRGLALPVMASLPHITVAGACATGTHGSGVANRNLAAVVVGLELVDGTGQVVRRTRDDHREVFPGCAVNLGALGIVTEVTLELQDAQPMYQRAWVDLPAEELADNFDELMGGAHSVSCFTRWKDGVVDTVLHKAVGDPDHDPAELFGAPRATAARHPIVGADTANLTEQQGRPGPWHERLPHFQSGFVPSGGIELQSEWYIPYPRAVEACDAMWRIGDKLDDVLLTSEIRTVAADDLWLSPACGRDVVGIHLTWRPDIDAVDRATAIVEQALDHLDPIPHWGKVSHADRSVWRRSFSRLKDFAELAREHDPDGRFRNAFLDAVL